MRLKKIDYYTTSTNNLEFGYGPSRTNVVLNNTDLTKDHAANLSTVIKTYEDNPLVSTDTTKDRSVTCQQLYYNGYIFTGYSDGYITIHDESLDLQQGFYAKGSPALHTMNDDDSWPNGQFGTLGSMYISSGILYAIADDVIVSFTISNLLNGIFTPLNQSVSFIALEGTTSLTGNDFAECIFSSIAGWTYGGSLYLLVCTASNGDEAHWNGSIVVLDSQNLNVKLRWYVNRPLDEIIYPFPTAYGWNGNQTGGAGIWGSSGITITSDGFGWFATGNSMLDDGQPDYAESIMKIDMSNFIGYALGRVTNGTQQYSGHVSGFFKNRTVSSLAGFTLSSTNDLDFGASPTVIPAVTGRNFPVVMAQNKSGILYVINGTTMALIKAYQMSGGGPWPLFIGSQTYDPVSGFVYIPTPLDIQLVRYSTSPNWCNLPLLGDGTPDPRQGMCNFFNYGYSGVTGNDSSMYVKEPIITITKSIDGGNGNSGSSEHIRDGIVAATINYDGSLNFRWQFWAKNCITRGGWPKPYPSVPTVCNGVVYFTTGNFSQLIAIDGTAGYKIWDSGIISGNHGFFAPPLIVKDSVIIPSYNPSYIHGSKINMYKASPVVCSATISNVHVYTGHSIVLDFKSNGCDITKSYLININIKGVNSTAIPYDTPGILQHMVFDNMILLDSLDNTFSSFDVALIQQDTSTLVVSKTVTVSSIEPRAFNIISTNVTNSAITLTLDIYPFRITGTDFYSIDYYVDGGLIGTDTIQNPTTRQNNITVPYTITDANQHLLLLIVRIADIYNQQSTDFAQPYAYVQRPTDCVQPSQSDVWNDMHCVPSCGINNDITKTYTLTLPQTGGAACTTNIYGATELINKSINGNILTVTKTCPSPTCPTITFTGDSASSNITTIVINYTCPNYISLPSGHKYIVDFAVSGYTTVEYWDLGDSGQQYKIDLQGTYTVGPHTISCSLHQIDASNTVYNTVAQQNATVTISRDCVVPLPTIDCIGIICGDSILEATSPIATDPSYRKACVPPITLLYGMTASFTTTTVTYSCPVYTCPAVNFKIVQANSSLITIAYNFSAYPSPPPDSFYSLHFFIDNGDGFMIDFDGQTPATATDIPVNFAGTYGSGNHTVLFQLIQTKIDYSKSTILQQTTRNVNISASGTNCLIPDYDGKQMKVCKDASGNSCGTGPGKLSYTTDIIPATGNGKCETPPDPFKDVTATLDLINNKVTYSTSCTLSPCVKPTQHIIDICWPCIVVLMLILNSS